MTRVPGRLARLPLRLRLVAGFTVAMLVVLTAAGVFVYWRVEYALDRQLNSRLVDTASQLAEVLTPAGRLTDESGLAGDESYQVLTGDGRVLGSGSTSTTPLIDTATVQQALAQPVTQDVGGLLADRGPTLRVYATALDDTAPGPTTVLAVAVERNRRDEALRELLVQLGVAGLATLLVTAVVGDRLALASLRPVERYRRQAADIASGVAGVRLDVPGARDDEITRLGHTLNDMLFALEEALERERRFVSDAGHELRTPLTLMRTRVQLTLRRPRSRDQHEQVLAEIDADIGRLSLLAEQLLAVGEPRAGGTGAVVDLAAVVRSEVERRRMLAVATTPYSLSGSLVADSAGPALVAVPRHQLERTVGNLLDNAAVHGQPPVTLTVDTTSTFARLVVTDAGAGMDAETLATAPDRFSRAPEARARAGSGLGLALVHAIVVAAGGELRLCARGSHQWFGMPLSGACHHGPEMTVTVLLPSPSSAVDSSG